MNYVDITQKLEVNTVEWFFGYGGNHLGLKRIIRGLRFRALCERDAFVVANMVSKMEKGLLDSVPIWTDCCTFPSEPFADRTDLFIASYPCQGFSHAGKRLGADDHRHLWPHCRRFIQGARPGWVWLENVEGHVSLGLSTVLADLEEDGYRAAWGIFSASEVGAPHQRKRVFILAYDKNAKRELSGAAWVGWSGFTDGCQSDELAKRIDEGFQRGQESVKGRAEHQRHNGDSLWTGLESGSENVAHHHHQGLQGLWERGGQTGREVTDGHIGGYSQVWPSRPGERQYAWEPPRVVVGEPKKRGERGEPQCGMDTGNEADAEREAHNDDADRPSADSGQLENPVQQRVQRGASVTGGDDGSGPDCEAPVSGGRREDRGADKCQTQPPMGGNSDGLTDGLDFPGCTGLSDSELEEIYGWMVKGTNRTDELRMCGNGVVPQTAERAFRVLYKELTGADVPILTEEVL